jgi:hypothetical protein
LQDFFGSFYFDEIAATQSRGWLHGAVLGECRTQVACTT